MKQQKMTGSIFADPFSTRSTYGHSCKESSKEKLEMLLGQAWNSASRNVTLTS